MLEGAEQEKLKVLKKALKFFNSFDSLSNFKLIAKNKELYAVSEELYDFLRQIKIDCIAGVKVGEIGKRLRLTLEGAFWLMRNENKKVWVNDHGEMLFLYGRDIFSGSIIKVGEFEENEVVFVCNHYGDILGIGKSRFSVKEIKKLPENRVVIENLVDRGAYLRHDKIYDCF